jgi:two-component sensor histidine kinase
MPLMGTFPLRMQELTMAMQEARISLSPSHSAPAMSRRVLDALGDDIGRRVRDDARLLLTELVTNSIRHAHLRVDDRISVRIRREDAGLLVEVTDPGSGFSVESSQSAQTGGWGLLLLDRLSQDWGVENYPGRGTTVWFRLGRP